VGSRMAGERGPWNATTPASPRDEKDHGPARPGTSATSTMNSGRSLMSEIKREDALLFPSGGLRLTGKLETRDRTRPQTGEAIFAYANLDDSGGQSIP